MDWKIFRTSSLGRLYSHVSDASTTNRIDGIFASLREGGRKALMPFVCAGYPISLPLKDILPALEHAGANIAEVGFPFSDPIADGPVIASAMHEAMRGGMTPAKVLAQAREAREVTSLGMVAMVSMSIVHRMGGPTGFCAQARDAGFDGLIVPDAPVEHSQALAQAAQSRGLTLSLLIAPTTPPARAETIAKACTGFVYLLARTGITGDQSQQAQASGPTGARLSERVAALRKVTSLPIACGFGIATAEDVSRVVQSADAAIVGSALVRRMGESSGSPIEAACDLTRQLVRGLTQA
jgi:tryptophan synthase alpha chain